MEDVFSWLYLSFKKLVTDIFPKINVHSAVLRLQMSILILSEPRRIN